MRDIRVILIDDHDLVRAGLRAVISNAEGITVVADSRDAQSGLESIRELSPNVVICDVNMPGYGAFEMVQTIAQERPETKVIFLTAFDTDSHLDRALQLGAAGFVSKAESLTTIVDAIREVVTGHTQYFSDEIKQRLIKSGPGSYGVRKNLLSPREQEVLCRVASGKSAKQIASDLTISAKTVERHKSNIMTKLKLHTQVDLTRYAIREGMIAP